jgi:hypothetical protein
MKDKAMPTIGRKPQRFRLVAAFLVASAAAALAASCDSPTSVEKKSSVGSLSMSASLTGVSARRSASRAPARTTYPAGIDLTSLSYSLMLTSSSSSASPISGGTSSTGSFATVEDIPAGTWTATVTATASGVEVGVGSAVVAISMGKTKSATVDLAPPQTGTGTLAFSASWYYAAIPTLTVTPIVPSGSASTYAPATAVTAFSRPVTLTAGAYRVELDIATTNGTTTSVQASISEVAYVFAGYTTSLSYTGDSSSRKSGIPTQPTLAVTTGYLASIGNYTSISWSGATGATSYILERRSASTEADLASASYSTITTTATDSGCSDEGLINTTWYQYRLTASNSAGSATPVEAEAPMSSLTLTAAIGTVGIVGSTGTTSVSRYVFLNVPVSISIMGATPTWTVTSGAATISSSSSYNPTVITLSNAVVISAN